MYKNEKKTRAKRANLLLFIVKYANLLHSCLNHPIVVDWTERLGNVQKYKTLVQSAQKCYFSLLNILIYHVVEALSRRT